MRFKFFLSTALLFSALGTASSQANTVVNPPPPYPQTDINTTGYSVYFGGSNTGNIAAGYHRSGFPFLNTAVADDSDPANLLWLDIRSNDTFNTPSSDTLLLSLSIDNTPSTLITLYGAGVVTGNVAPPACVNGSNCLYSNKAAVYSQGSTIRVSVSLHDICNAGGSVGSLCLAGAGNGYQNLANKTLTQTVNVSIGHVNVSATPNPPQGSTGDTKTTSFTLGVSDVPPTVTCPSANNYFFPGDNEIQLFSGNFATSAGNGTTVNNLAFLASLSPIVETPPGLASVPIFAEVAAGGPIAYIKGLTNDVTYHGMVYAENIVGILGGTAASGSANGCQNNTIVSKTINGVLARSKCFIATAAYQDGDAPPVKMLRKFRDEVLAKSKLGKKFIETYYRFSPPLAEWAWDKPIIRSFALRLLAPVELGAYLVLKLSHGQEATPAEESYTEKLKKELDQEKPAPKNESYTEKLKRELQPEATPAPKSYSEELKKDLPTVEEQKNYSDAQKKKLPPESTRESPIKLVKENRDRLYPVERPEINNAFSFKMGLSTGMDVVDSRSANTFSSVYGNKWQPDFWLHYERETFRSESFGSFGPSIDTGISVSGAPGLFSTPYLGSRLSHTQFTLIQFPVVLGAYYRMNFLKYVRPYAGAGLGGMFYDETRKDDVPDTKGVALIYTASAGASLLLDFFDANTSYDAFSANGIQHVYLVAEFLYMNTFTNKVVFKRAGVYTGFLYEF